LGVRQPLRYHYFAYGLDIDSDVPFDELESIRRKHAPVIPGHLRIRISHPRGIAREPENWMLQTSLPNGRPWMWAARHSPGFLLRYVGMADFVIDAKGSEVVLARTEAPTSRDTIAHLLLDQILPMVLGLRGIPTLHASAVSTTRGVCAFMGASGVGKSTLAASFGMAGYAVLGDDCVAIKEDRGFFAIPAYPGLRLWTDSAESMCAEWKDAPAVAHYTRKRRVISAPAVENFPARPKRLAMIYSLVREAEGALTAPEIQPVRPNEAFLQLLSASFMLDITDRLVLTRNLRFIERLLASVPIRRLRIPAGFSSLPKAREAVLRDIGAADETAAHGMH
jgi:hypothetical protein